MQAPTTRLLGPGRIAALGLVLCVAIGLSYLRFAPDAGRASVPAGAHAGQLTLQTCTYDTERGAYAADCGTLVVPENRHDAGSRLIALPVTRIKARSAHPGAPVFRLQGGPGLSNMHFRDAGRFADRHDVVLVGYRGVDGSVRLDCPEVESAMKHARDLVRRAYFTAAAAGYRTCAARLRAEGIDLGGYSLPERADDLDAARRALGYRRIDLLSESAGTRTALIYAWRHPARVERSVMVGVNPPGNFLWYPGITDQQLGRYAALCAHDAACSARTGDLAAAFRETSAHLPGHWWFLPIKPGNVRLGTFFGLMHATGAASPISGPMTIDSWLAATRGDASGLWLLSTLSQLVFPDVQVKGDVAAVSRSDAAFARRFYGRARARSILESAGTDFLWGGGLLRTAWPAGSDDDAYSSIRTSQVPTLLVEGELDFATPPQTTRQLLAHLPHGRQVVLRNLGHTDDFWSHEPRAGTHLVTTFLETGRVDASRYSGAPVDFTPGFTQTKIAKIVLGSMLGLAGLAALLLLWLPLAVLRHGRVGRVAGGLTRWVWVVVLGLGGWCLGALVALSALPTVPLDGDLLVSLSVGLPIGLGVFWAWVQRSATARTKGTGFAAALAGALVGAWLGGNAVGGILGVLTAVAGAAAMANLLLVALDVACDRAARESAATVGAAGHVGAEAR